MARCEVPAAAAPAAGVTSTASARLARTTAHTSAAARRAVLGAELRCIDTA
ncbi:MAG: hypothetical protein ACYCSX_06690 [Acidimicrobiales bacterium]